MHTCFFIQYANSIAFATPSIVMAGKLAQTRVVKRLAPDQPGALKHARRYGDALVCVRYRHDAQRRLRYTTVELVVDEAPLKGHPEHDATIVSVRIDPRDTEMHRQAFALGAQWNDKTRIWTMTRKTLRMLGLQRSQPHR